ncbi:MAG TPA: class I SAM-dependent methyltransferase [Candidatus Binataceae bacterium]|nr:class I SAM-dependent methyltransferase [Candidatus Binataceae bacterium]
MREHGHYEHKQLGSRSFAIRLSHRGRFLLARRLIAPWAGARLLDYGCGDGTFMAQVVDLFPDAVGADYEPGQVADCRRRFADYPRLRFSTVQELRALASCFDLITCMEVLEHCRASEINEVLSDLRRLLAPSGTLLVSVPIEIGPSLILKQMIRRVAGWRNLGDYRYNERYTVGELVRMTLATARGAIARPLYDNAPGLPPFHTHKGFNWRTLRERIGREFALRRTCFSPFRLTGSLLNSQAWFICGARGSDCSSDGRHPY